MKKILAVLLALVMMAAAGLALADETEMPEAAAGYEGTWECDRATAEFWWEEEGFKVLIRWGSSAWETTEWEYSCYFDEATGKLSSLPFGLRTECVYGDDGSMTSFTEVYNDGEADFFLDEEGYLIWEDKKEDAGAGMRFEKVAEAEAGPITPLPARVDIAQLEDRFVTTDIVYKGNGIAVLTLYEREQFDGVAIRNAQIGDVIVTDGEEITVESLEWDGPDLYFNRGTATEMLFCETAGGAFEHVTDNDLVPQVLLGTLEQEILPYMILVDWVDPKTGDALEKPAVYDGDELKALLESGEGPSFEVKNVRVLYDNNNQPSLFIRYYSPLQ